MKLGRLRHSAEFKQAREKRSTVGQIKKDWETVARACVSIDAITGTEGFDSSRYDSSTSLKITARWSPGLKCITAKDVICADGRLYGITSVVPRNNIQAGITFLVRDVSDDRDYQ